MPGSADAHPAQRPPPDPVALSPASAPNGAGASTRTASPPAHALDRGTVTVGAYGRGLTTPTAVLPARQRRREVIEAMREGVEPPHPEREEQPAQVVDLMDALRSSVEKARTSRGEDATVHEMPERKKKTVAKKARREVPSAAAAAEQLPALTGLDGELVIEQQGAGKFGRAQR